MVERCENPFVRALAFFLAASLLLPVLPRADSQQGRLEAWLDAVREHEDGHWDTPAQSIGRWSSADLRAVYQSLKPRLAGPAPRPPDVDVLLVRGAMLHTDIAVLGSRRQIPAAPGDRSVALSIDGRDLGQQVIDPSWEFARQLLDGLSETSGNKGLARLWYRATIAHMAKFSLLGDLRPHLEHAVGRFPADPDIVFDTGWMYESLAGPRTQAVAADLLVPRGMRARIEAPNVGDCLQRAERLYTRVLASRPDHLDARIGRGRVYSLRGNQKAAIADLRTAVDAARDPIQKYFALLFLGGAYEALENVEQARAAYERASTLYAFAQSPHLALSRLATRRGDMPAAQREIQKLLGLSPNAPDRGDPWWLYAMGSGRHTDALFNQLRAAVAAPGETS